MAKGSYECDLKGHLEKLLRSGEYCLNFKIEWFDQRYKANDIDSIQIRNWPLNHKLH